MVMEWMVGFGVVALIAFLGYTSMVKSKRVWHKVEQGEEKLSQIEIATAQCSRCRTLVARIRQ